MENNNRFLFDHDSSNIKSKNLLTFIIIYSIAITIISIVLVWMLIDARNFAHKESTAKTEAITEKGNLLNTLKNMEMEYDELSQEYEELDSLFTAEKTKIQELVAEINNLKGTSTEAYKAKVAELGKRLKEYEAKIDELKSRNEKLTTENLKTKNTLDSALNNAILLDLKNNELSEKIKNGTALKAYDLSSVPLRLKSDKKEAPTHLAKKVEKVRTCFTLSENIFSAKGYKVIYLRIADPDGAIMADPAKTTNTFTFKGKSIRYSEKLEFYYNNKSEDICLDWVKTGLLKKGIYYVDVFINDTLLGTCSFSLE
jgi:myosin heavy subunit